MIDLSSMIWPIQKMWKRIILSTGLFRPSVKKQNERRKWNCFIFSTGKDNTAKDYYTLESIIFLLKNVDLQHANYVKKAGVSDSSEENFLDCDKGFIRLGKRHSSYKSSRS